MNDPDRDNRETLQLELAELNARFDAWLLQQRSQEEQLRSAIADLSARLAVETPGVTAPEHLPEMAATPPAAAFEDPSATPPAGGLEDLPAPPLRIPEPVQRFAAARRQAPPVPVHARSSPAAVVLEAPSPAPATREGNFELQLGRVWLGRIGIAVLVTGLVLLGNFAYKNWVYHLPVIARLLFVYLGAGILTGTGLIVRRRESTATFGEVVLAGGLAFGYWCTYAAHHVPRLRVIESDVGGALAIFGAAAGITVLSLAWRSRIIGVMGLLLASYSTVLQPLGWLSAVSNLALALAGVVMMLRGRWPGPGLVALLGSYGSFFWWQLAGHPSQDPAALWFLPPVWVVFAGSVLLRPSIEQIFSPRDRSLYAGINNFLFFGLFTSIWVRLNGTAEYWQVPAVFGVALLCAGFLREPAARPLRGQFVGQGLAAITLAVALKFDGYQLALALAMQSLLLSAAFSRFSGRTEFVFAAGTILASAGLSLGALPAEAPAWSHLLVALGLLGSGVLLRKGCDGESLPPDWQQVARSAAAVAVCCGSAVLGIRVCGDLELAWSGPALAFVAFLFGSGWLRLDRGGKMKEFAVMSPLFALASAIRVAPGGAFMDVSGALVAAVLAGQHLLWSRSDRPDKLGELSVRELNSWLTAILAGAAGLAALSNIEYLPASQRMWLSAAAGLAVVAIARYLLKAPRLMFAGLLLFARMLMDQGDKQAGEVIGQHFLATGLAVATVFVAVRKRPAMIETSEEADIREAIARFIAGLSWFLTCLAVAPDYWGEIMALTALGIGAPALIQERRKLYAEAGCFLAIAISWFAAQTFARGWHRLAEVPTPHGWAIVIATLALALLIPASADSLHRSVKNLLLGAGTAFLAIWSSHWVVWSYGPKPLVVLWALIGFAAVSAGLWRKLAMFRQAGFAILALAMGKLFLVDVWNFEGFIRILAFLALGVALVGLGFLYNRFSEVIRKLFEMERNEG